jgi:hypothetical protein
METFLWSMILTVVILFLPLVLAFSPFIVRKLAENELFWATCKEGQTRPVTWNKKFKKFIISYAGKCYAGELDKSLSTNNENYWEVVNDPRPQSEKTGLEKIFEGLYWIGLPPFAEIMRYRMTWIEWGHPKKADGSVSSHKEPIPREETISHALVQSDVYFVKVPSVETAEGIPVDVSILLTAWINNPYKALFRVQHWLEAVTNQTEGTSRVFIGTLEIKQLFTLTKEEQKKGPNPRNKASLSATSSKALEKALKKSLENFKDNFGVTVDKVQIQSIEPAGDAAAKYRELLTKEYEATQEAKMVRIKADAEADRIRKIAEAKKEEAELVLGAVTSLPGGLEAFHSQNVGNLPNLQTYVEGNKGRKPKTVVAIPTQSKE